MTDQYRDKFGGSLRILNQVPRWGCVPRIKENSVAQHSFWVTLYTMILCDYLELSLAEKYNCIDYAVRHDLPEAATGDILGPVKRSTVDPNKMWNFIIATFKQWGVYQFLVGLQATDMVSTQAKRIVKAADLIDDVMVLSEEMAFGNKRAAGLFGVIMGRLRKALVRIECGHLFGEIMASCQVVQSSPMTIIQNDEDLS